MSLSSALYVCALWSFFPAVLCERKSDMSQHELELKEHYDHLANIAAFKCDRPQPRLYSVEEFLPLHHRFGKAYFPEVTILHRCDESVGSCDSKHRCGVTDTDQVRLPFKITYLEDMGDHRREDWEIVYYNLENHTSCGCLQRDGFDKPPKATVHFHYIDPSLLLPQYFPPLDYSANNVSEDNGFPPYQSQDNGPSETGRNQSEDQVSSQISYLLNFMATHTFNIHSRSEDNTASSTSEPEGYSRITEGSSADKVRNSPASIKEPSDETNESSTVTSDLNRDVESPWDTFYRESKS